MESNGDTVGEAATQAGEFIEEKNVGEDSGQYQSGGESVQSGQANGEIVPVEELLYGEPSHPSEPIFRAVQRQFYGGDESE